MAGMLRVKDEQALRELLNGSHLKLAGDRTKPQPARTPSPPARTKLEESRTPASNASRSELEIALQIQIEQTLPAILQPSGYDVPYLVGSRHRLDVCWAPRRFGVEVQGMPHRIKGRFKADIHKRAIGLLQGWTILEVDGDTIRSGQAIEWIRQLLVQYPPKP